MDINRAVITISGGKDSLLAAYIASKQFPDFELIHVKMPDYPEMSEYFAYIEQLFGKKIKMLTPERSVSCVEYLRNTKVVDYAPAICCGKSSLNSQTITRYVINNYKNENIVTVAGRVQDDIYNPYPGVWHKGQILAKVAGWETGYTYYPIWHLSRTTVLKNIEDCGLKLNPIYQRYSKCGCIPCPAWWTEKNGMYLKKNLESFKADYPDKYRGLFDEN